MKEVTSFEERDEFHRKKFAQRLINLILEQNDISPICINGLWGTGKTEFCKKTNTLIEKEYKDRLSSAYLNAFAADAYDDPLSTILVTLYKKFEKTNQITQTAKESFKRFSIKILAKVVELIYPGLENISNTIIESVSEANANYRFNHLIQLESQIQELRDVISSITKERPFVLFIDELDRCRPDYALHLLEIIKHVFEIDGLKIVFILNKAQFIETIKHRYGNNEKTANNYLDKFFHLKLKIPKYVRDKEVDLRPTASAKYLKILLNKNNLTNASIFIDNSSNERYVERMLIELTEAHDLTLRDVEKLLKYFKVYINFHSCESDAVGEKLIIAFAIFSFVFNLEFYRNFRDFGNPLRSNRDLSTPTPSKDSIRYLLYLILLSNDFRAIAHLFNGLGSLLDLRYRQELFRETLGELNDLFDN